MAISTGQFTIVDYNDAVTLTGFIGSNLSKVQLYQADTDTFTPDWSSTSLVLTPELYRLGEAAEIFANEPSKINSVTWQRKPSNASSFDSLTTGESTSGTNNEVLTVSANKMDDAAINSIEYLCTIVYSDDISGLDLTHKMSITLTKVKQGNNVAISLAYAPNGNTFKNGTPTSLTAQCDFYRGGTPDTTDLTYQWQRYDGGWVNCSDSAGVLTGTTTATMTVYPAAVDSMERFRCQVTDTDTGSPTYNETITSDSAVFIDYTDPIQVVIESTGGNVFKNGVGSTDLTAILYRDGEEIDSGGTTYTYTWTRLDKDGAQDPDFGGTGVPTKTGKTIAVGTSDVDVKATFICEIS